MIKKIAHIAIAVNSVAEAAGFYAQQLGLKLTGKETVPHRKVTVGFIQLGETKIELVQPDAPDAPVARFLAERGPGLHHICFEVDDIEAEFQRLKDAGVRIVDPAPQPGADGTKAFFIHPKATGGVLIELSQKVQVLP
uniref:Methylmalonyl-CoA epimerase n=1 Tax=candidate division WOR-3 bacterium TaxID=2052148 RepID=A0A7V3PTT8_UNCW3